MRPLRITLLALSAALLLSAAPAQSAPTSPGCGLAPLPELGNIHRFIGEPVTYDLTNNDTRYFQATVAWEPGANDGAVFNPGDSFEFSHSYTSAGSYDVFLIVRVADPAVMGGMCSTSLTIGTVRVRGHGPH